MLQTQNLILHNANVITMDPNKPRAKGVMCRNGRILGIIDQFNNHLFDTKEAKIIDCGGRTILPGFIDSHIHFLAYASSLKAVDCSPQAATSITAIAEALSLRSKITPAHELVKGVGYDEFYLAEKRHPNKWDLDRTIKEHPAKLIHRSGHICVLNSYALNMANISLFTPEPQYGFMERDIKTGEPTGVFIDLDAWIDDKLRTEYRRKEMGGEIKTASEKLLSVGITSFQDASHLNSISSWNYFKKLKDNLPEMPRITVMPGYKHIQDFIASELRYGAGDDHLRVGHTKVLLSQASGSLHPQPEVIKAMVSEANLQGFPIAIHAVEETEVEAALEALESNGNRAIRNRIEHCSICPPSLTTRLKELNIVIATQPSFIYYGGDRYLCEVPKEQLPHLYPLKAWVTSGITVAGSSDSPIANPDPLVGIKVATNRRTHTDQEVFAEQALMTHEALTLYGSAGAYSTDLENKIGKIKVGMLADLIILNLDPTYVPTEELKGLEVLATIIGGRVVWDSGKIH